MSIFCSRWTEAGEHILVRLVLLPPSIKLHLKLTRHFVLSLKFIDRGAALMFPIAPVACLGLSPGLASAARAESPLAEIGLAEIRFAKTAIAAPEPLAKECSFALSHLVALLLRWTPSPAPAWTCRYRLGGKTLPELPSCFHLSFETFQLFRTHECPKHAGPGGESTIGVDFSCRSLLPPVEIAQGAAWVSRR